ncbi:hypothetical protein Trco_001502 [Trichoderma cornu-damae]|uniref:Uncharacterized protein n=1 Tax=Trichoderma cornu-damae TaxID=654480 RepID=A0A9P8U0Y7_9HYPO|nr:hypothetical protein Trco_001502 [Trichoderma cornu-damae]
MLPKDQSTARLQQSVYFFSHGVGIGHRAQHLDAEHRIEAFCHDAVLLEDVALLHAAHNQLVYILKAVFEDLLPAVRREMRIDFYADNPRNLALIEAAQLIAQPGAELEDDAAALRHQSRDHRAVRLEADKVFV